MRKTLLSVLVISVLIGMFASCRKTVLTPPVDGAPPPHPGEIPQYPKLEETEPPLLVPVTYQVDLNIKGYYKALPARYYESTEKYPVIIYFHGGGQYGNGSTDLSKTLEEGIPKLINEKKFPPSFTVGGEKFSFIVVAPQFVRMATNEDVDTLVTYVKNTLRVDTSRIYLSGLSLGARMLTNYAAYKPNEIAAITGMGGVIQLDNKLANKCFTMAKAELPVWQFHNKDDQAWYYNEASRFIEVFNSFIPAIPPRFTSFEVGEARLHHDCWTRACNPDYKEDGKNIYEWMLQYTR